VDVAEDDAVHATRAKIIQSIQERSLEARGRRERLHEFETQCLGLPRDELRAHAMEPHPPREAMHDVEETADVETLSNGAVERQRGVLAP